MVITLDITITLVSMVTIDKAIIIIIIEDS